MPNPFEEVEPFKKETINYKNGDRYVGQINSKRKNTVWSYMQMVQVLRDF